MPRPPDPRQQHRLLGQSDGARAESLKQTLSRTAQSAIAIGSVAVTSFALAAYSALAPDNSNDPVLRSIAEKPCKQAFLSKYELSTAFAN